MKRTANPRPVNVTDHAIVRYLERSGRIDVEALRREIVERVQHAADLGAGALVSGRLVFVIGEDDHGPSVITVLRKHGEPDNHMPRARQK
jgi:hypothetical protein